MHGSVHHSRAAAFRIGPMFRRPIGQPASDHPTRCRGWFPAPTLRRASTCTAATCRGRRYQGFAHDLVAAQILLCIVCARFSCIGSRRSPLSKQLCGTIRVSRLLDVIFREARRCPVRRLPSPGSLSNGPSFGSARFCASCTKRPARAADLHGKPAWIGNPVRENPQSTLRESQLRRLWGWIENAHHESTGWLRVGARIAPRAWSSYSEQPLRLRFPQNVNGPAGRLSIGVNQ